MTRPVSEVLINASLFLYHPVNRAKGEAYICHALYEAMRAGAITESEESRASEYVMAAVKAMHKRAGTLAEALTITGRQLRPNVRGKEYLAFRDKWLNALIDQAKREEQQQHGLPESPTPRG